MDRLLPAIRDAAGRLNATSHDAATAIMTTDLAPKEAAVTVDGITVGGIAKGSGMIHPNMATMLAFVATDADVESRHLQELVEQVADRTFNAITVDGDMSTSDTFTVQATGLGRKAAPGTAEWQALKTALYAVCRHLARAIAADGEGATHLIECVVEGLPESEARRVAREVIRSPLVKTAIAGRDANWGRVVGAMGAARAPQLDQLDLDFAGIPVLRKGAPVAVDEDVATRALGAFEVQIHARLPGKGLGRAWGCDLTSDYVRINADYRS
jgi:glutamate N-acetyltransferase/amino-acid N-acetyltransferase